MKKLINIIQLVASNYIDKINLLLEKNLLTLEYLTYRNGEQDIYKTLQVEEFEDRLKVTILPEKITKITELNGLEKIFFILDKQCNTKEHTPEEIQQIKEKYCVGTKVELIQMYDLQALPAGTKGVIVAVDALGTLQVDWENGSNLGLVVGTDEFKIMESVENEK